MERTRQRRLVVLAATLVGVLLLLVAGLRHIEFEQGYILQTPDVSTGIAGGGNEDAEYPGFSRALQIAFILALAVIVIGPLFIKELRRYLYLVLIFVALLFVVSYFEQELEENRVERPEAPPEIAEMIVGEPQEVEWGPDPEEETASESTVVLIAIGLSVLFVGGAFLAARAYLAKRRRTGKPIELSELNELVHSVDAAASRLRAGDDPRTVVLFCYREMVDILSRRGRIVHEHLTPREFADSLVNAGMAEHHVDELTEVFELVRYGERGGQGLADRAMISLEAIRDAYEEIAS